MLEVCVHAPVPNCKTERLANQILLNIHLLGPIFRAIFKTLHNHMTYVVEFSPCHLDHVRRAVEHLLSFRLNAHPKTLIVVNWKVFIPVFIKTRTSKGCCTAWM